MLNDLVNYCVPDLHTVILGIPASDFHTNYRLIILLLQCKNAYWIENVLSVDDGLSLTLSLSLNYSIR